jgi:hypothetical protein
MDMANVGESFFNSSVQIWVLRLRAKKHQDLETEGDKRRESAHRSLSDNNKMR